MRERERIKHRSGSQPVARVITGGMFPGDMPSQINSGFQWLLAFVDFFDAKWKEIHIVVREKKDENPCNFEHEFLN